MRRYDCIGMQRVFLGGKTYCDWHHLLSKIFRSNWISFLSMEFCTSRAFQWIRPLSRSILKIMNGRSWALMWAWQKQNVMNCWSKRESIFQKYRCYNIINGLGNATSTLPWYFKFRIVSSNFVWKEAHQWISSGNHVNMVVGSEHPVNILILLQWCRWYRRVLQFS